VLAFQLKLIWFVETALAVNPPGTLGAVVSGNAAVVAQLCALCADAFPALSYAATV
jgi:hypothetical protein